MGTDINTIGQIRIDGEWVTKRQEVGGDRKDYDSFIVLADVMNKYSSEKWEPIAPPRGLPDDFEVDEEMYHSVNDKWMGYHSFSWVTLSEIESYINRTSIRPLLGKLPYLKEVANELRNDLALVESSDDIRLVFGFDS